MIDYTSVVTNRLDVETEAKSEAVYLETKAEEQGSWSIILAILSLPTTIKPSRPVAKRQWAFD